MDVNPIEAVCSALKAAVCPGSARCGLECSCMFPPKVHVDPRRRLQACHVSTHGSRPRGRAAFFHSGCIPICRKTGMRPGRGPQAGAVSVFARGHERPKEISEIAAVSSTSSLGSPIRSCLSEEASFITLG